MTESPRDEAGEVSTVMRKASAKLNRQLRRTNALVKSLQLKKNVAEKLRSNARKRNASAPPCKPDYAIEEYRILQQTISDWGKQRFTIRRWIITIFAVLTAAHLSEKISPIAFVVVSVLSILPLAICELFEGAWQSKAIHRTRIVEESLRGEGVYDGPGIHKSLSTPATLVDAFKEFPKALTAAFYIGLFLSVTAVGLFSQFSTRTQTTMPSPQIVTSEGTTTSSVAIPTPTIKTPLPSQSTENQTGIDHTPEQAPALEPVSNGQSTPLAQ